MNLIIYKLGENNFTDMSDEFNSIYLRYKINRSVISNYNITNNSPDNIDGA